MNLDEFITAWRLKYPASDTLSNQRGNWQGSDYILVKCPYCAKCFRDRTPDTGHHLHAHYAQEWFKCHRCGTKGGMDFLIGRRKAEPTGPWKSFVLDPNKPRPVVKPTALDLEGSRCKPGNVIVPLAQAPRSHPAWDYLLDEGFTRLELIELAQTHGIYVCLHGKQFTHSEENTTSNRLIFQIQEGDKILGWQARWLPSQWPPTDADRETEKKIQKYLISPGMRKDYVLYNWTQAQKWDMWVMVEGIKKVWKTGPFAMCNFGVGGNPEPPEGLHHTAYQKFWSVRLAQAKRPVVFLYDKGAEDAAENHAAGVRKLGGTAIVATLPEYGDKDLDKYHRYEIRSIIQQAAGRLPKPMRP